MGEKKFVDKFVAGSADLVGVALVIGVARSINLVMENGMISDTILYHSSNAVAGMNSSIFIIFMLIVFIGLDFLYHHLQDLQYFQCLLWRLLQIV